MGGPPDRAKRHRRMLENGPLHFEGRSVLQGQAEPDPERLPHRPGQAEGQRSIRVQRKGDGAMDFPRASGDPPPLEPPLGLS